jgi:predicted transcriptional regulator
MDRRQKEALIIALAEKGKTYREIAKEAGVSPNTIKAVLNRAGLDQTTSITSRVFELYSQDKTPLEVAIALGLKADEAINLHREYFKLLGCTEFAKVYHHIKDNPGPYVNFVKLAQASGMSDEDIVELLNIAKGHLPRVTLEYDRVKAELNSLKDEKSNSAKEYQQLCNKISEMKTIVDQLQLNIRESKEENSKLELQKIKLQNFVKDFQDNNIEYNKVKQAIEGEVEYVLADRRRLLRMAIQSVIELLRLDPQKFHAFYHNQSTIQPENDEEPALVEAEQLYEKMLENITNKVITDLSDDISSVSSFAQKESSELNSDDMLTFAKEERTLSDTEDKGIERNLFKERNDVLSAGHRMISFPYRGQAWHPNFDTVV